LYLHVKFITLYAEVEHSWSRLLKQQSSITVYRLPIKENKLLFPFAANKWKFAVSFFYLPETKEVSVFHKFHFLFAEFRIEPWRHGEENMETWKTWRHGDMETWRHGDMETWRHGDMETWRHGDMETFRHGNI
jgi:hypothetical protein